MPLSAAPLVLIAALAGEIKMLVDERQQSDSVFQLPIRKKKIYQEKKSSQKRNSCQEWQTSSCLCFFPPRPPRPREHFHWSWRNLKGILDPKTSSSSLIGWRCFRQVRSQVFIKSHFYGCKSANVYVNCCQLHTNSKSKSNLKVFIKMLFVIGWTSDNNWLNLWQFHLTPIYSVILRRACLTLYSAVCRWFPAFHSSQLTPSLCCWHWHCSAILLILMIYFLFMRIYYFSQHLVSFCTSGDLLMPRFQNRILFVIVTALSYE